MCKDKTGCNCDACEGRRESKDLNPGCGKCSHRREPLCDYSSSECKLHYTIKASTNGGQYKDYSLCNEHNDKLQCKYFKPSLLYRFCSIFTGNWCVAFGHKLMASGSMTNYWCDRQGCNYTEKLVWPEPPPMPPVKEPKR